MLWHPVDWRLQTFLRKALSPPLCLKEGTWYDILLCSYSLKRTEMFCVNYCFPLRAIVTTNLILLARPILKIPGQEEKLQSSSLCPFLRITIMEPAINMCRHWKKFPTQNTCRWTKLVTSRSEYYLFKEILIHLSITPTSNSFKFLNL